MSMQQQHWWTGASVTNPQRRFSGIDPVKLESFEHQYCLPQSDEISASGSVFSRTRAMLCNPR